MNIVEFKEALIEKNIILTDNMLKQFQTYYDLIVSYNKVMDLTAISDDLIYERNFYDSLSIAFNQDFNNLNFCDVGAGAGFPSIPLKIIFPKMKLTIIDPLNKRMNFLKIVIEKLGLTDVNLVIKRVEEAKEYQETFDIVSARAVARLNILIELVSQIVKVQGHFIAMKGNKAEEELKEASNSLKECNFILVKKDEYANLTFIKIAPTKNKYPRPYSQIKHKPL